MFAGQKGRKMFDKFRRKLAKWIAPKPKKRVKKEYIHDVYYDFFPTKSQYDSVKEILNNKSYRANKRNKQAVVVGVE